MPTIEHEWPNFAGVPEDDALTMSRPKGQALARWVWYGGNLKKAETLNVHYYANALHYGTAVFEGIRCYPSDTGPVVVRLSDHISRFMASAALYGMSIPYSEVALVQACLDVARKNGIDNGYIRPLAYFGEGPIDLKPKKECPVRVFVAIRELGTFLGEGALRNGVALLGGG